MAHIHKLLLCSDHTFPFRWIDLSTLAEVCYYIAWMLSVAGRMLLAKTPQVHSPIIPCQFPTERLRMETIVYSSSAVFENTFTPHPFLPPRFSNLSHPLLYKASPYYDCSSNDVAFITMYKRQMRDAVHVLLDWAEESRESYNRAPEVRY